MALPPTSVVLAEAIHAAMPTARHEDVKAAAEWIAADLAQNGWRLVPSYRLAPLRHDANLVERLAAHCHDAQWSGWMRYMFSRGTENDDGTFTINGDDTQRWRMQAATPYVWLPEEMRPSDRREARRILDVVNEHRNAHGIDDA